MVWIIALGTIAIVLYRFITALNKDNYDLQNQSVAEKFQVIADNINNFAFNGRGKINFIDKRRFSLYEDGQNQIIYFLYSTGHLTITWKYKYFQKELVHERQIRNVRNLSIFEQQRIVEGVIREVRSKIESHKRLVMTDSGIPQMPNDNLGFNSTQGVITSKDMWLTVLIHPNTPNELKAVIQKFLIPDNIDIDKFSQNEQANEAVNEFHSLETFEMIGISSVNKSPVKCTASFRHEYVQNRLNRALGMPDWIYIAYPDVVIWLQQNMKRLEVEFAEREDELFKEDGPTDFFYRLIIDRYKSERGKLECAV